MSKSVTTKPVPMTDVVRVIRIRSGIKSGAKAPVARSSKRVSRGG